MLSGPHSTAAARVNPELPEALDRAIYQRALCDEVMRERASRLMRHVLAGLSKLLLDASDSALTGDLASRQRYHEVLVELKKS